MAFNEKMMKYYFVCCKYRSEERSGYISGAIRVNKFNVDSIIDVFRRKLENISNDEILITSVTRITKEEWEENYT